MDPKLLVFPMDHSGTVDSPGTAGEGAGEELQRPQHARVMTDWVNSARHLSRYQLVLVHAEPPSFLYCRLHTGVLDYHTEGPRSRGLGTKSKSGLLPRF